MLAAYSGMCGRQHIFPWSSFCRLVLSLGVYERKKSELADLASMIASSCLGFGLIEVRLYSTHNVEHC